MSGFASALEIISSIEDRVLSTGSPELDRMLGRVGGGVFYLFYGDEGLVEELFTHLLVNALKPHGVNASPTVVYAVCGNYRIERNVIDTEPLLRLLDSAGLAPEEALRRIRVLTASSADQQGMLAQAMEAALQRGNVSLVLVRGIYKLQLDDARKRRRDRVVEEMQRSIARMRRACSSAGVPLMASAREVKASLLPRLEASSYLGHAAGVTVYLRSRGKGSSFRRAFLVKSPTRPRSSTEYSFMEVDRLGRITPPIRESFNETVAKLRKEFRESLVKPGSRRAFDRLVEAWSAELGAITFAESVPMFDLMLLTAVVENYRLLENLEKRLSRSEKRGENGVSGG